MFNNKIFRILSLILISSLIPITNINASEDPSSQPPAVTSQAAIVYHVESGNVLYGKNIHMAMKPASITKLLTAILVAEHLSSDDLITFSDHAINSIPYDSSRVGLRVKETVTVSDAMHAMLLMSANEAANGLAEGALGSIEDFVAAMNAKAEELGAHDSSFKNPHGLNEDGHYTSAYDMALIAAEAIKSPMIMDVMSHSFYTIPTTNKSDQVRPLYQQHKMLNNKNDMRIYRDDVIAGKVGYTSESGHTLVTVASNGDRTLVIVTLNTPGANLYSETNDLIDYGYVAKIPNNPIDPTPINNKIDSTLAQASGSSSALASGSGSALASNNTDKILTENDSDKASSTSSLKVKIAVQDSKSYSGVKTDQGQVTNDNNLFDFLLIFLLVSILAYTAYRYHGHHMKKKFRNKYKQSKTKRKR